MRAAVYARVSTTDQNCELQIRELQACADRQGWSIVDTYQDTMSGAKANRPDLNRLMLDARARKFDCLLVWKLDRFGRSLVDCLNNIRTLEENGIRFIAVTQGLDTNQQNPASRFLLHVLGAAAEFERALISGHGLGSSGIGRTTRRERWAESFRADPERTWLLTGHRRFSIGNGLPHSEGRGTPFVRLQNG